MAFFNKVGETISSKSRDVAKKAKDFAEVSSLNGQINSQEDNINKMYLEIGKQYFNKYKDMDNNEYPDQCSAIKDAMVKIDQLRADINKIKGIMICQNCGAEIPDESAFCPGCGSKVVKEVIVDSQLVQEQDGVQAPQVESAASKEPHVCPECGSTLSEDAAFCTSCGHKLS